jgi:hypothetical protein
VTTAEIECCWANPRAGALIEQAQECQRRDDHDGALELLEHAIVIPGPDAAHALAIRAASFFALGRTGEARSQLAVTRVAGADPPDHRGCRVVARRHARVFIYTMDDRSCERTR